MHLSFLQWYAAIKNVSKYIILENSGVIEKQYSGRNLKDH